MTIIARCINDDTQSSWRTLSSYGHYGATLSATKHTTINYHDRQQVYVVKTRKIYIYYY